MKFLVAAIVGLGIMLLSPASAQWGSQPSTANCRAYLTYPAEFGDLPFIYRGVCPNGTAEGRQTVVAEPDGSPQGTTFTITSTFKNGRTTGQTSIRSSFGVTFDGFIGQNGIVIGRTTFPDGHAADGESRKGRMWTGIVSRSADVGGGTNYFVSGTAVSQSEYEGIAAVQNVSLVSQPQLPSPGIAAATNGSTSGRPPCYMELPFIKNQMNVSGSYPGICIGGKYHGQATFQLDDPSDPNFIPMEYTVNVKDGKVFGVGLISIGNGAVTYTGTLKNYHPWDGTNVAYDERGNPVREGFLRGKNVPLAQAPRTLAFTPYVPPKEPSAPARQAKAGACFAERPTDRYFVTGQFSGECKSGKYSGSAELTLSPKDPHDPIVKLTATYRDGTLSGPVKAVYPQYALTYRGTFDGFVVGSGRAEQPLGNRTFDITEYQNGQIVSTRTEYRPPSEFEQALIAAAGRLGERLGTQLGREIDGTAARERDGQRQAKADKLRRDDIARADEITREAQATAGQKVRDEQLAQQQERDNAQADRQRQSDATIEDARSKALSGLDAEGNPVSPPSTPVKVASNDPPNFGGKTSPPEFAVKTNPPETQTRPIVTTNPPEVPAPHPAAPPSIPEPEKVAGLPSPHSSGVQPPLGPVTPLPDPSSTSPPVAPAVQPPRQNDTLGTVPAPSNPDMLPTSGTVNRLDSPSQPADVVNRPAPIPANSPPTTTTLAAPMRIAPTNPGELAPTIPIQWTPVSGATRYELAVRDLTTNAFVVDQSIYNTIFERSPYPSGRTFRWTVRACNQSGCGSWSQGWTFRTAGAVQSTSGSCDASLTPSQQQTINRYYQLPSANGVTRWTDSTICSMKSRGVLEQRIAEMQAEIDRQAAERRSWWTASFSERHRVAVNDVVNSEDVKGHIQDIKQAILARLISRGFKNPEKALARIDFFFAVREGINRYSAQKNDPSFLNDARMANFINSQIVDALATAIAAELGFPIPIPLSSALNLSGAASAVYVTSFIRGR